VKVTAPDPVLLAESLAEDELRAFVLGQRWFGSKTREVSSLQVTAASTARTIAPLLVVALVECRFDTGTHDTYHLPLGFRPAEEGWTDGAIGDVAGWTAYDAAADPAHARELAHLMRQRETLTTDAGRLEFRTVDGAALGFDTADVAHARPIGTEQSNTSIVFEDEHVLKLYRRIDAGINPELELLRFLTERGFEAVAPLEGWIAYVGHPMDATLAILQRFVPGAGDGWELALEALRTDATADALLERLRRLGEITARMHSLLASEQGDPNFCPELPSAESMALLTASIDEEIAQLFLSLPDDVEALEEVRERLRLISAPGAVGRVIRTHGDYHLGQVLWTGEGWIVLDFEGEPARSLPERRRKRSPLRDVAGMLRSFAYAASASPSAPAGWEQRARQEFIDGYLGEIDTRVVPSGDAFRRILSIFELEKAVYELRYELDNRPGWVAIPVAGIQRLLEETA
jgi:maltokinase